MKVTMDLNDEIVKTCIQRHLDTGRPVQAQLKEYLVLGHKAYQAVENGLLIGSADAPYKLRETFLKPTSGKKDEEDD